MRRIQCPAFVPAFMIVPVVIGAPVVVDNGEDLSAWKVIAAEGVEAAASLVEGPAGEALRLDYNFAKGSGFCVIRRQVKQPLPANYRFRFKLRGEGPPNNLEFKLVDPSGENVWWINRRAFELPREWTQVTYRARQFQFAWGPSGGARLGELGAIEIAIAASSGGKGALELDELTFEELPPVQESPPDPVVTTSSSLGGPLVPRKLGPDGAFEWTSDPADAAPQITIDFQTNREFGGLILGWSDTEFPPAYDIEISEDGDAWIPAKSITGSGGGHDYLPLRDAEARKVRIRAKRPAGTPIKLYSIRIAPPAFGESPNVLLRQVAADAPRGWYPRYLRGEQTAWTVVGVDGGRHEALFSADGALEAGKGGFSIEPFVIAGGKLITWANVDISHRLLNDYLPIPTVLWTWGDLELSITALAEGDANESHVCLRYDLSNKGRELHAGQFALAMRPFQVLPPWQELNMTGGFAPIADLHVDATGATIAGLQVLRLWRQATAWEASSWVRGETVEHLAIDKLDPVFDVSDPQRMASACWMQSFSIAPAQQQSWAVTVPLNPERPAGNDSADVASWNSRLDNMGTRWRLSIDSVRLELPPSAKKVADTFRTTQAHILLNRDGPAIQPGSRNYERSWIRDGALTSTALLATGHTAAAREFLDWYAGYQYESGKIPCVVDARGPDPVNENDSNGEYLYALLKLYRCTHSRLLLEKHLPHVIKAVDYIVQMRAQRSTPEYENGGDEKRAYYGLVTESISHEGYSAKPMHSYWDNFFVQKGLRDAVTIAQILGRKDLEETFTVQRDAHAKALHDSLELALKLRHIDYLPGCVELGDFDATSTAIAFFPCGLQSLLPPAAISRTFDKYYDFFAQRRDGRLDWTAYTPYEVRLIGTFALLGQRQRCAELIDFFLKDQRPSGWNQWAEVVHRDKNFPGFIGDMPHTWVGSDFINAIRTMLLYERGDDDALIIAGGVPRSWIEEAGGVAITDFPTEYGDVSYQLSGTPSKIELLFEGPPTMPPGGVMFDARDIGPFRRARWNDNEANGADARFIALPATRGRLVLER